jgi:adenylylsulfate kinase-like enzyme
MGGRVRAGLLKDFTGIDAPYEAPVAPEVSGNAQGPDGGEALGACLDALRARGVSFPD